MKRFTWPLVIAGMLIAAGCDVGYYSSAPPPVRIETRIGSPGNGFVWVDGYWGNGRRGYDWVPGRWVRPPRGRTVWVAPAWELHNGRYRFHKGHWR